MPRKTLALKDDPLIKDILERLDALETDATSLRDFSNAGFINLKKETVILHNRFVHLWENP